MIRPAALDVAYVYGAGAEGYFILNGGDGH